MWYLIEERPEPPPAPRYWLGGVSSSGRTIGRKHVDIQLKASSVSRNHARLTVVKGPFYAHPHPARNTTAVTVLDSSAYGTFLKYPLGHLAHRSAPAHHSRLDKHTPTEIADGARLAFGAPSAWWRLVRHHMVVVPSRLSDPERLRLGDVAAATALDVSDVWTPHATHLVTNAFNPASIKHLCALASRAAIVNPAFIEAVNHIVVEACRAATEAASASASEEVTRLPDPAHFRPTALPPDSAIAKYFPPTARSPLDPILSPRRERLFKGIIVAFSRKDRHDRFAPVVEACGGIAALSSATHPSGLRVIVVSDHADGKSLPEAAFVASVLIADPELLKAIPLDAQPSAPDVDSEAGGATPLSRTPRKRPAPPSPDFERGDNDDADDIAESADAPSADADSPVAHRPVRKRARISTDDSTVRHEGKADVEEGVDANASPDEVDDGGEQDAGQDAEKVGTMRKSKVANEVLDMDEDDDEEEDEDDAEEGERSARREPVTHAQFEGEDGPRYHDEDVVSGMEVRPLMAPPTTARSTHDPLDVRPFRPTVVARQPAMSVVRYTGAVEDGAGGEDATANE